MSCNVVWCDYYPHFTGGDCGMTWCPAHLPRNSSNTIITECGVIKMPKYINVDEAIEHFRKWEFTDDFPLIKETLDEIPSADVVKVKHGEWQIEMEYGAEIYTCSECGIELADNSNFCPNCGADMIERKESE